MNKLTAIDEKTLNEIVTRVKKDVKRAQNNKKLCKIVKIALMVIGAITVICTVAMVIAKIVKFVKTKIFGIKADEFDLDDYIDDEDDFLED